MAARPDLAALVRRIYIHPYLLRAVSEEEAQAVLEEVLIPLTAAGTASEARELLVKYLEPFDELQKETRCPQGATFAGWKLIGVLLALVRNLERLSLQVKDLGDFPAPAFVVLRRILPGPPDSPMLSKLKTLDVCPRNDGFWRFGLEACASGLVAIIKSCNGGLSTLNLYGCGRIGSLDLRGLQSLRLCSSRFGNVDVAAALRACSTPGLKSFHYLARGAAWDPWQCIQNYSPGHDHFQPTTAIEHLLPRATTLTSLHLDLRNHGESDHPDIEFGWFDIECLSSTQTSLSAFSALKYLILNAATVCNNANDGQDDALILTRLLPPNIESLCLAAELQEKVKPRMARALVHLARTVGDGRGFTGLKAVKCDEELAKGGVLEAYGVPREFERAGVDFGWDSWEMGWPALKHEEGTPEPEFEEEEDNSEAWVEFDADLDLNFEA